MSGTKVEIIYTDNDIIVVNKPAGVSVTRDRTGASWLADILAKHLGTETAGRLRLVHRLDKDTSGVMILAKTKESQSLFSGYFAKRVVTKTYLALVAGPISNRKGTVNASLAPNRKKPQLMCVNQKKGKKAVTEWRLLADFGSIALLFVKPLTGRTHQIRAHLAAIGLPLAIDPLYGSSRPIFLSDYKLHYQLRRGKTEKPLIDRLTLHSYQIQLTEPSPNLPDCFIAGLDKKFAATIKMLTKHNPIGPDAFINPPDFSKIINIRKIDY